MDVKRRDNRWKWMAGCAAVAVLGAVGACGGPDGVGSTQSDGGGQQMSDGADAGDSADATGDTGGGAEDVEVEEAQVNVTPPELQFEGPRKGKSKTLELVVQNNGGKPATLNKVEVKEVGAAAEGEEFALGDGTPELPVAIPGGVFKTVEIVYSPTDYETDRGMVSLQFSNAGISAVEVPIDTINAHPDIDAPELVRFGSVPQGEEKTRNIVLYNRGLQNLRFEDVRFKGDENFSVTFDRKTPPVEAGRNDPFSFDLSFKAPDEEPHRGQLLIDSNDPDQKTVTVDVTANRPKPCIQLQTTEIDFGDIGQSPETKPLKMLNCSRTRTLTVSNLGFSSDGNGAFKLADKPEFPLSIPPASEESVTIEASLERVRTAYGLLVVRSNDEEHTPIFVDLRAARTE